MASPSRPSCSAQALVFSGQSRCAGSQLQRRQGAGGSPSSAWVHAPIVPTNNGGDERALALMTQTQVWGAAGWLLKGRTVCCSDSPYPSSTARVRARPPDSLQPRRRLSSALCRKGTNLPALILNLLLSRARSFPAAVELRGNPEQAAGRQQAAASSSSSPELFTGTCTVRETISGLMVSS